METMHAERGHIAIEPAVRTSGECLRLIRAEYLEMPGLNLTRSQVQRLLGLDCVTCDSLLCTLVDAGFLRRTRDERYVRAAWSERLEHVK